MAKDEVQVQLPTLDRSKSLTTLADTTASTVTQANGTKLTGFTWCKNNSLHITIKNSSSSTSSITFKAGDFANNVMGDLTQAIGGGKTATFIIDNPSRFQTNEGDILIFIGILKTKANLKDAKKNIKEGILKYLKSTVFESSYVSYAQIGACILASDGVLDYKNLKLNNTTDNIAIAESTTSCQIATLGELNITIEE